MNSELLDHTTHSSAGMFAHQQIDALNIRARALREADAKQGLSLAQTAYAWAKAEQYQAGMLAGLANQSHCYSWLSNFVQALTHGLEALRLAEALDGCNDLPDVFLALARAHLHLANLAESVDFGRRACLSAQACGDRVTEADALNVLGINYYRAGRYALAFSTYADALALHRALENVQGVCKVLVNIAQAHSTHADYDQALAVAHEGLQIAQTTNSPMLEAYMLHTLGQIYADKGAFEPALAYLAQALPAADAVGNQYVRLVTMVTIGQVYMRSSQTAAAIPHVLETLALAERLNTKLYIYRCHEALATLYEQREQWQQALDHYRHFHTIKETVFDEAAVHRLQGLEILHEIETARREAEIYHLRNVALEQEIAERRRLEAELLHQATTDVLTGVANRRHFLALARSDLAAALEQNRSLALALIDLDTFKHINDTYGHALGDEVLRFLAQTCVANLQPTDRFARFGGDEFVVLFSAGDLAQAQATLERIRQALADNPIVYDAAVISISISSGIAMVQDPHDSLDALLARADQALYRAKRAGRNRVALSAP